MLVSSFLLLPLRLLVCLHYKEDAKIIYMSRVKGHAGIVGTELDDIQWEAKGNIDRRVDVQSMRTSSLLAFPYLPLLSLLFFHCVDCVIILNKFSLSD